MDRFDSTGPWSPNIQCVELFDRAQRSTRLVSDVVEVVVHKSITWIYLRQTQVLTEATAIIRVGSLASARIKVVPIIVMLRPSPGAS